MKTSELNGIALDWAVAKCEGLSPFTDDISWIVDRDGTYMQIPKYSTDWAYGGPIIEREKISIERRDRWVAYVHRDDIPVEGATPLIAAMQLYVAGRLGDEVQIPEGL